MAEPRMVTCDLCQQPREAGFLHTNAQCINALLARVRKLTEQLSALEQARTPLQAENTRLTLRNRELEAENNELTGRNRRKTGPLDQFIGKAPALMASLREEPEREGAAVVKTAQQLIAEATFCWDTEYPEEGGQEPSCIDEFVTDPGVVYEVALQNEIGHVFGALIGSTPRWFLSQEEAEAAIRAAGGER